MREWVYIHFEGTYWKLTPKAYLRFLLQHREEPDGIVMPNEYLMQGKPHNVVASDGHVDLLDGVEQQYYLLQNIELAMMGEELIQRELENFLEWWVSTPD